MLPTWAKLCLLDVLQGSHGDFRVLITAFKLLGWFLCAFDGKLLNLSFVLVRLFE